LAGDKIVKRLFRELFSYTLDVLSRRWPIRIASIAVQNEGVALQSGFELVPSQMQCQVVVIGADRVEFCAIFHFLVSFDLSFPIFCLHGEFHLESVCFRSKTQDSIS